MAEKTLKSHAIWSVVLQFSRFGGNALVFLAMARFLTIEQIGAFGMAYAPVRWAQVLHKSGILSSVVVVVRRKKDNAEVEQDDPAFTALFWLAMLASALVCGLIFLLALGLGRFSSIDASVDDMMLAMLIVPIAFGVSSVPEGLLQKNMQVKAIALRTLAVQLGSAAVALVLAMQGYGGWAMVWFAIMNAVLSSVASVFLAGWWPKGGPDLARMRAHLPQMSAISGRGLVAGGVHALLQFSVGLAFGLAGAGAFQIAQRIHQILDALCLAPVRFLVLPLFSKATEKGDGTLPGAMVLRALTIAGLISAPVYCGTILVAAPVLTLVIGAENASHAVPTLQILCCVGLSLSTGAILSQALTAVGRAGLAFWRVVGTLVITVLLAGPSMLVSVEAVTLGYVIAAYASMWIFLQRTTQIFDLTPRQAFTALARPYLAALIAFGPLFWLQHIVQTDLHWSDAMTLVVIMPLAVAAYVLTSRLVAPTAFSNVIGSLNR
ncbi:oligosaccharide flippase family protein [Epibacterium ulvae]|uniref:oligosaccharide flippase family protein n=1 Tax=Epibacterium ulvae TaxID=1156985 RepID=UPI00248F7F51|nr:oligosaccharide flippase family protein [Epibacterium ulvae]